MGYRDKEKHKLYHRNYQRNWMANRRQSFFKDKSCVKCGSIENLELDHIDPKLKVTHNVWSWTESKRLVELAKCQILCKKCHLEKTIEQMEKKYIHGTTTMYRRCKCSICIAGNTFRCKKRRERAKAKV